MILADKIINERKKNGWTQEELAEKLSVSRQSVSKWEGAQAVPDLQKIIAMADIFGVSTDYLIKDEIEPDNLPVVIPTMEVSESVSDLKKVSLEDANEFLEISKKKAPKIANGVSLCIISPIVLIVLAGLSDSNKFGISDILAVTVGLIVLLTMVATAVFMFIVFGAPGKKYEFLEKCNIETAYGVEGLVKERKRTMESHRTTGIAVSVILCILSSLPLIITACLEVEEYIVTAMVGVLLIVVSVAVNMLVRIGVVWNSYLMLLEEGDFSVENKAANKKIEKVAGIYWSVVSAGYLAWSFITMRWDITWIVWPVAAILFGVVSATIRTLSHKD